MIQEVGGSFIGYSPTRERKCAGFYSNRALTHLIQLNTNTNMCCFKPTWVAFVVLIVLRTIHSVDPGLSNHLSLSDQGLCGVRVPWGQVEPGEGSYHSQGHHHYEQRATGHPPCRRLPQSITPGRGQERGSLVWLSCSERRTEKKTSLFHPSYYHTQSIYRSAERIANKTNFTSVPNGTKTYWLSRKLGKQYSTFLGIFCLKFRTYSTDNR